MSEPEVPHFDPDRRSVPPGAPIVLTGADLTVPDVEAVARAGAPAALDHARPRADAGGARPHRIARRRGRRRLRRDDGVRGTGLDPHPAVGRRPAPGEPPDEPCRRGRTGLPARGRPGDAAVAGQHARARPQRLPAAAGRSPARVPRSRHPPGRARTGKRRGVGRPGAARASGAAVDRPRPGRIRRVGRARR